jgi:hypothetical protein
LCRGGSEEERAQSLSASYALIAKYLKWFRRLWWVLIAPTNFEEIFLFFLPGISMREKVRNQEHILALIW